MGGRRRIDPARQLVTGMTHYRKLVGSKCYLSPAASDDAELWTRWLNDPEVALPLGDEAYAVVTTAAQERACEEIVRSGEAVFTIVDLAWDAPVGRCLLFSVNKADRCAEAGIFVSEKESRGKGIGTEAMSLLLDYAFNLLSLNSVMIGIFAFNERARRQPARLDLRLRRRHPRRHREVRLRRSDRPLRPPRSRQPPVPHPLEAEP